MEDSIFTKIVKGEIAAHKIYEDDKCLAFLDIKGTQDGHTLVITKKQVDHIWDLPDDEYIALMATVKKVAKRIREVLQPTRVGVKVMGEGVPHVHVHLIPFDKIAEYNKSPDMSVEPDHDKLAEIAKRLAF